MREVYPNYGDSAIREYGSPWRGLAPSNAIAHARAFSRVQQFVRPSIPIPHQRPHPVLFQS